MIRKAIKFAGWRAGFWLMVHAGLRRAWLIAFGIERRIHRAEWGSYDRYAAIAYEGREVQR